VAMARSSDPNSASSQFYITLSPTPFLDGNYAVFGRVTEGLDVVRQIRVGDKMNSVTIVGE
jgi:peptidyl-prolyl cis-trans isomerase B (cyclophilin B)